MDGTLARLRRRFGGGSSVSEFWQRRQGPDEVAGAYIEAKARLARRLGMDDGRVTADVITHGLRPEIKKDVIMQRPSTIEDLLDVAETSEASNKAAAMATTAPDAELRAELADLRAAMSATASAMTERPPATTAQETGSHAAAANTATAVATLPAATTAAPTMAQVQLVTPDGTYFVPVAGRGRGGRGRTARRPSGDGE